MPQLDINLITNFIYWLCLSFSASFFFFYLTFFFSYVNKQKLIYFYKVYIYLKVQYLVYYIRSLNDFKTY